MKKPALLTFSFLFILACASAASAQWRFIGIQEVDDMRDHDTFYVAESKGRLRALQLRATNAPVHVGRMGVHFDNGGSQELEVPGRIRRNGQSRALDLRGERRDIRTIELWYRSVGNRGKARISIYGRG